MKDKLRKALESTPGYHRGPGVVDDCPTYYDMCNCRMYTPDIARTICTTLGITREMVVTIRDAHRKHGWPDLDRACNALTALRDLAEGDT